MATFIPTPNTVEVVIKANRVADARVNVFHVRFPAGEPGSSAVQPIADTVGAWARTEYVAQVTSRIGFDTVTARDISVLDGAEATFDCQNTQGLNNGDPLPGNVCALVSLHTAQGGRSGRGRVFWFETDENNMSESMFSAVYANAVTTSLNLLRAALDAQSYSLAVGSRKHHLSYPVTSVSTSRAIATQRDRLPGRRARRKRRVLAP